MSYFFYSCSSAFQHIYHLLLGYHHRNWFLTLIQIANVLQRLSTLEKAVVRIHNAQTHQAQANSSPNADVIQALKAVGRGGAIWSLRFFNTHTVVNFGTFILSMAINTFVRLSDGMRYCRSDWPGLCLFCCYQPLCVVLGFFCFIISFVLPPPP